MLNLDLESIGQVSATLLIVVFFVVAGYKRRLKVTRKKNDGDQDYLHWL